MKTAFVVCLMVALSVSSSELPLGSGEPFKYISSCEIDLNADDNSDIAMLIETVRGRELIVLMKTPEGYNAFVPSVGREGMFLSCQFGDTVTETMAGPDRETQGRVYNVPGAYLELSYPEGPSFAFFWNGSGFSEVWTAD